MHRVAPQQHCSTTATLSTGITLENYSSVVASSQQKRSSVHSTSSKDSGPESGTAPRGVTISTGAGAAAEREAVSVPKFTTTVMHLTHTVRRLID